MRSVSSVCAGMLSALDVQHYVAVLLHLVLSAGVTFSASGYATLQARAMNSWKLFFAMRGNSFETRWINLECFRLRDDAGCSALSDS